MATQSRSAIGPNATITNDKSNTHDTLGNKEDFSDIIGLLSPYDTPCYSTFRKVDAVAPVINWQYDELQAAAAQAVVEGADITTYDASSPGIAINYTQIFEKTARVTSTAAATEWYGRASEMDFQLMKRGREIKRDIEFAIIGAAQTSSAGSSSAARTLAGVEALCATTTSKVGAAMTEADILTLHQGVYEDGGDPNWLLVTPNAATTVANFAYIDPSSATVGGRIRDIEGETRLVNVVEIYQGPFGTLSVVTDKFSKGAAGAGGGTDVDTVALLETDRWAIPVLQPITTEDLGKDGHSDRKLVSCEVSLLHENEDSSACLILVKNT